MRNNPPEHRSARLRGKRFRGFARAWTTVVAVVGASVIAVTPSSVLHIQVSDIRLTAGDDSFQPALDQLLNAMQQAVAYDSSLPFATPDSDAMLLTGLQNTNYELLSAGLSRVTELFNGVFFQSPEAVAGDAADSRQYFQFFTPDIYYHATAGLAPGATYELTGTVGKGTEALAIATEAITGSTVASLSLMKLTAPVGTVGPMSTVKVPSGLTIRL
jgi:hypothetical protein